MADIFDVIGTDGFEDELFLSEQPQKEKVPPAFKPVTTFNDWTCRCHQLGDLMTKPKSKSETLSATAKAMLNKSFAQHFFGKQNAMTTKELEKGLICEPEAIELYNSVFGTNYEKNVVRLYNEFLQGECDIHDKSESTIIDIKNSWGFTTFPLLESSIPDKAYEWQVQGYMDLYGCDFAQVAYCLVDTPLALVMNEKYSLARKLGVIDLPEEVESQLEDAHIYNHLPKNSRVKVFSFEKDETKIEQIQAKVVEARKYLNELLKLFTNG